jgi:dihydroorotate dehydrogenase electron transfer subunit
VNIAYVSTQISRQTSYGAYLGCVELTGPNIGAHVQPGQFAMLLRPGEVSPARPRPYAYFAVLNANTIAVLVRERPETVASLLRAPIGTPVPLLGPLGTSFGASPKRVWAVAGGVGAAAFGTVMRHADPLALLRVWVGIRSQADSGIVTALAHRLRQTGAELDVSCEDGTLGRSGSVVDSLISALKTPGVVLPDVIYACGPEAMLQAVAALAKTYNIACQVSLGVAMDCGVGTCGSCRHTDMHGHSRLACVQGPIYPADQLYP